MRDYLKAALRPLAVKPLQTEAWIEALRPEDDSEQLGLCIAIDLRSGAVEPIVYARLLDLLPEPPYHSARRAFADAVGRHSSSLKLNSCFSQEARGDQPTYVNVLDMETFLDRYVMPSYYLTGHDLQEVRDVFFQDGHAETLEQIQVTWEGPDGLVWVTSRERLRELLATGQVQGNAATHVHNALGKGGIGSRELVYVQYPAVFDGTVCAQPTALDLRWIHGGGCYLSAAEGDCWGRSHSRTGDGPSCEERVHGALPALGKGFSAYPLGVATPQPRNPTALLDEGRRRFDKLASASLL